MTNEKIIEVLDRYEQKLTELVESIDRGGEEFGTLFEREYRHALTMIPKMRVLLEEDRREKLMRWLGFLQGVLWTSEVYELEELKDHNKPDA